MPLRLVVDERRVFLVRRIGVGARRMLQLGDRLRRPGVLLAAHPPGVLAAGVEHGQAAAFGDRKSTRLNSSHGYISYAVFCLKKKRQKTVTVTAESLDA